MKCRGFPSSFIGDWLDWFNDLQGCPMPQWISIAMLAMVLFAKGHG